jgi:hypothetical protein
LFNRLRGYVAVCVQLYCGCFTVLHLVVAVLHYMFLPTWPSSGVYYVPEVICFAVFVAFSCTWLYSARFHLWGGLNMMYYYLLLLMLLFLFCYSIYIFLLTCAFLLLFSLIFWFLCVCLPFLVVCRFCAAICCLFHVVKHHTPLKMAM